MESSSQDRRLPASERKLRKARDDGQVTRSVDLSHLAILGAGALTILTLAPRALSHMQLHLGRQLKFDADAVFQTGSMLDRLGDMALVGILISAIFAVIVMAASTLSAVAVGGWVASTKPVTPDFSRLNPLSGLGRLFSKEKVTETAKLLLITILLAALIAGFLSNSLPTIASLILQPTTSSIRYLGDWLSKGLGLMLLIVLLVALIDIPLQSFLHRSRLKMSHQEVKQEHKESEGSPEVKNKMRAKQREFAQKRSLSNVPKADFVLMNPTHYAVAIRYDDKSMVAPRVISKGTDLLAMRIRAIAKDKGIPMIESPVLARALFAHAELDKDIPTSLYTAVAQVLAYIYRLKAAMRGDGPMPGEPPVPAVPAELDPLHASAQVALA